MNKGLMWVSRIRLLVQAGVWAGCAMVGGAMIVGCESLDTGMATVAALEAVQAITLSDDQIRSMSVKAAVVQDQKHQVAPPSSPYVKRLQSLVARHQTEQGLPLNYKVYLADDQVNAFAMADGTVRVYSGLMNILTDEELLFVIGHEVGHVIRGHSKRAAQVAYSTSAIRKGATAVGGAVGDLASSELGSISEKIISAQFSQHEEKDADDYGLQFLQRHGYNVRAS
ncbi:MAG: M48 family metalloprotease, partial [Gammaproteobacteria bacterium]